MSDPPPIPPAKDNTKWKWITIVLALMFIVVPLVSCIGCAGVMGLVASTPEFQQKFKQKMQEARDKRRVVTLKEFNQLKPGMKLSQVVAIIGSSGTVSPGSGFVSATWQNSDGTSVKVMFDNDRLIQKYQVGF